MFESGSAFRDCDHVSRHKQKGYTFKRALGKIKLREMIDLIGVQDLARKEFKLKGENVESKFEGKVCGARHPKDIWKVKEIGNMLV